MKLIDIRKDTEHTNNLIIGVENKKLFGNRVTTYYGRRNFVWVRDNKTHLMTQMEYLESYTWSTVRKGGNILVSRGDTIFQLDEWAKQFVQDRKIH